MFLRFFAVLSVCVCALVGEPAYADPTIHAGDRVGIKVYNHPELSSTLVVDSRGYLPMPLVGAVYAAGLEPTMLAERIRLGLVTYMRFPAVEAQIAGESATVFVTGGPGGVIAYEPGLSLGAALAQLKNDDGVDILHSRVDLKQINVERDHHLLGTYDLTAMSASGMGGPILAAGDTISLHDKPIAVQIDGDLKRPGTTFLDSTQPLSDALDQLGGLTTTSANAQVVITRDGSSSLHGLGDTIFKEPAHAGDRVMIPTAPRVTIAGMVGMPGPVVLKNDFTLLSALYSAGGPNKYANLKVVQVVHHDQRVQYDITRLTHGDLSQNPILRDGDVVFVPEGYKIDFSLTLSALSTAFAGIYAARTIAP